MAKKNNGTKKIPSTVAPSIPYTTLVPTEWRLAAPAPLDSNNGTTPRMKAKEVIRIGRNRSRAASRAASRVDIPWARSSVANSTMRMAFLAARPITVNSPTWK